MNRDGMPPLSWTHLKDFHDLEGRETKTHFLHDAGYVKAKDNAAYADALFAELEASDPKTYRAIISRPPSFSKEAQRISAINASALERQNRRKALEQEKASTLRQFTELAAKRAKYISPSDVPRRDFLLGNHYIRKYVSITVAPGGLGKSSLSLVDALSMVSGYNLVGEQPKHPLNVWMWNGEDPMEELQRRVAAACLYHDLTEDDICFLFLNSGREDPLTIVRQPKNNAEVSLPDIKTLKMNILQNHIDVLILDPVISLISGNENDNSFMQTFVRELAKIADECDCAIELVHHTRKTNGNEGTVEDGRGASSLLSATRAARVLNQMTKEEAEAAQVSCRRSYFRVDDGKTSMTKPAEKATWYHMASQRLPNGSGGLIDDGDDVGVCTAWTFPDVQEAFTVADLRQAQAVAAKGEYRESDQSDDWLGHAVGDALGLKTRTNKADKRKVKHWLRRWIANGMFEIIERKDEKSRKTFKFLVVGEPADD